MTEKSMNSGTSDAAFISLKLLNYNTNSFMLAIVCIYIYSSIR